MIQCDDGVDGLLEFIDVRMEFLFHMLPVKAILAASLGVRYPVIP